MVFSNRLMILVFLFPDHCTQMCCCVFMAVCMMGLFLIFLLRHKCNKTKYIDTATHTHTVVFWTKSSCCVEEILKQEDKSELLTSVYSQHADNE